MIMMMMMMTPGGKVMMINDDDPRPHQLADVEGRGAEPRAMLRETDPVPRTRAYHSKRPTITTTIFGIMIFIIITTTIFGIMMMMIIISLSPSPPPSLASSLSSSPPPSLAS
jgi:hypothetical protein